MRELASDPGLRELEDDLLRPIDEVRRLTRPLPAEAGDLLPRADEPAERRHLPNDPGVVGGVGGGGDEGGELVDSDAPARILQLPSLLERIDEGDRVDGLPFRVQRKRGPVDLRVTFPVEISGVEDLADGPDRPGGEHHRAEDRLLGIEILGRDRGRLRRLGDLGDHPD